MLLMLFMLQKGGHSRSLSFEVVLLLPRTAKVAHTHTQNRENAAVNEIIGFWSGSTAGDGPAANAMLLLLFYLL